ncbi:helix-turn-helix domain-containing protein [Plantactinospora endophytica]|uniref:helix-turn-helix domain-containing protein n=1 Tax=Plantactinospora endophytica TaxID=673535 RepID=UPI001EF2F5A3|nr:helix-turn-helix transcriptional regulator [Plantactinospora endophytica]
MGISPLEFLLRELRRRRKAANMSQEALGAKCFCSSSQISAIENGTAPLTLEHLRFVDAALETDGYFENAWDEMVKDYAEAVIWLREWIVLEREAAALRWYEQSFIPGIFQTEAYARATLGVGKLFTPDEIDKRVASRMERQSILSREKPPSLTVVLDQSVLERTVGRSGKLMAEQLDHLIVCAELPSVQVHVVPSDVGLYPGLAGSFIIATMEDNRQYGHLDHQIGADIIERPSDIANLTRSWEAVRSEALPNRQSLDLIKEVAKRWT